MNKARVAIIGTGNIGCDLIAKIQRSPYLSCALITGRNIHSPGSQFALAKGIPVSARSIQAIMDNPSLYDIVFDATTAEYHKEHAPILRSLGMFTIDLTPSQIGKMCVPLINSHLCVQEDNVNLITCAGQATIPIIDAVMSTHPEIEYVEVVASISSKSAGPGTRANIDEFTQTTTEAIRKFCNVPFAKAIIILNPAEPPIMMHNTIYFKIKDPCISAVTTLLKKIESKVQQYVPGYHITCGPICENNRLTVMVEVVGLGDYLPAYSGNLDIITCAAVTLAEEWAARRQNA